MITILSKADDRKVSEHFHASEFSCKCHHLSCNHTLISGRLLEKLEILRNLIGPININSGFRCSKHNYSSGGVELSQHKAGNAADVRKPRGMSFTEFSLHVESVGFKYIKKYESKGFIHCDVRP